MSAFLQLGLLCWYFLSLYLVIVDTTIPFYLKVTGQIINILCIGFIATNMFNENVSNIIYYVVGGLLVAWFLYYTPQDFANTGYTDIERYLYTSIDIITLLYVFTSLGLHYLYRAHNELSVIKDIIGIKRIICSFF